MTGETIKLKALLQERHWQKHTTFCREYDRAAEALDPDLKGSHPSRAQLHRWLAGELKGLPYPDHCRILEEMFPGWSAAQLFMSSASDQPVSNGDGTADVPGLFRAVAAGLDAPDSRRADWGPAPSAVHPSASGRGVLPNPLGNHAIDGASAITRQIGSKLLALAQILRLDESQLRQLAGLAGNVVELEQHVDVEIAPDGWASVRYRHELFNMSDRPLTRLARELWFEHTRGQLVLTPIDPPNRRITIQRLHDTASLAKFACHVSPAIKPGESAVIAYTCTGGQFVSDHYWRQALPRYTRQLTISLRHGGAGQLIDCSATEEHADGSENSVGDGLTWDYEPDGLTMTLTRDYLRPGQAVTLRWKATHASA